MIPWVTYPHNLISFLILNSDSRPPSEEKSAARSAFWFAHGLLHVELVDGRVASARYEVFPRLAGATAQQRDNWELIGEGVGIHWPDVDEDLSTDGLIREAVRIETPQAETG